MIRFENDYSEGAHPDVLRALNETNLLQTPGYGTDEICERARDLIRTLCESLMELFRRIDRVEK